MIQEHEMPDSVDHMTLKLLCMFEFFFFSYESAEIFTYITV